jgi:hypothetical protein
MRGLTIQHSFRGAWRESGLFGLFGFSSLFGGAQQEKQDKPDKLDKLPGVVVCEALFIRLPAAPYFL